MVVAPRCGYFALVLQWTGAFLFVMTAGKLLAALVLQWTGAFFVDAFFERQKGVGYEGNSYS